MPTMWLKWDTALLLAAGCVAVAGLVYQFLPEQPNYSVEQSDRVFDSLPAGETHRFTYRVRNLSSKPIRVVGAEFT